MQINIFVIETSLFERNLYERSRIADVITVQSTVATASSLPTLHL
jgi:hypothetical protein